MESIAGTTLITSIDAKESINDVPLVSSNTNTYTSQDQLAFLQHLGEQSNTVETTSSIAGELLDKLQSINPAFTAKIEGVQEAIGKVAHTNSPIDYMNAFMQMSEFSLTANFTVAAASQFSKTIERVTNLQ